MVFNQARQFEQGYVSANNNIGVSIDSINQIFSGVTQLNLNGSTGLSGVCTDNSGNIYVTDAIKHIILKITDSGNISVIAGLSGTSGDNSGNTVSAADSRFNYPTGICCDSNGDLFVCDTKNHQIRKISNNKVSLIAGATTPTSGTADGVGSVARFNTPYDVDIDPSGVIYIADTFNHAIRKIIGGSVTTIAGSKGISGDYPKWENMTTAQGVLGTEALFDTPYAIAINGRGYVFVSDTNNHVIKRVDPAGRVRIFSGSGEIGTLIGSAKTSQYQDLKFSDMDLSDDLYIVDFQEDGASRLLRVNEEGVPGVIIDFATTLTSEGQYLASVAASPSSKLKVVLSEYTEAEYSSSSSSSSDG